MTKNLTEGDPARLIFFFALPLVAGNMMQQLYSFVDTLIVGRFLGVNALAAVGCTGSLMFLALGFLMGFCTGVTIYTGQRFGADDRAGVRQSGVHHPRRCGCAHVDGDCPAADADAARADGDAARDSGRCI